MIPVNLLPDTSKCCRPERFPIPGGNSPVNWFLLTSSTFKSFKWNSSGGMGSRKDLWERLRKLSLSKPARDLERTPSRPLPGRSRPTTLMAVNKVELRVDDDDDVGEEDNRAQWTPGQLQQLVELATATGQWLI
ncbi:unnamed protein product [Musa acuminata subsp. malaccensis]|uniref:(wild Malaysian banana) hypothetical protein n=1 Tax=Musa acuminata subsp. malaccensis TaxID=214687 RepID=A0A8D6ZXN2_MUSAM|nr:unnamed protein product [Musa acuminata subsp. malaccensis]